MNLAHCIIHGAPAYDLSEADAKRFAPAFNSIEHLMARAPEILGTHYDIAYPARQLTTARNLRHLPLHNEFEKDNAYMGQFYGWERPLYFNASKPPWLTFNKPDWFENVRAEVQAAHTQAAVFDLSSFGKIDVRGPDAEIFLMRTCAGYVNRSPGSMIYSAVLNQRGTFESDVTAQRIAENHYRLFVGTQSIKKDLAWFSRAAAGIEHKQKYDIVISDVTEIYATLALMGPGASTVAASLGAQLENIGYFKHAESTMAGIPIRAARLSYVGEAGWEITCKSKHVKSLYKALQKEGVKPAGLFAQTSMRIEKGYRAMGHELDSDVSPLDTGLEIFTRNTGGFTGYAALQKLAKQKPSQQIVSLVFSDDAAVPLGNEPIIYNNEIIGKTTSCAFGYRIGKPVALSIASSFLETDMQVEVDIAGSLTKAKVNRASLFDPTGSRLK